MTSQGLTINLRISPNAKKNKILGLYGEKQIKVSVACPPIDGRANETLVKFIAETFSVSQKNVEIIRGETSQYKTLFISGDPQKLEALLQKILAHSSR